MEDLSYKDEQICFSVNNLITCDQSLQLIQYMDQSELEKEDTDLEYKSYNYVKVEWSDLPDPNLRSHLFDRVKKYVPEICEYNGDRYQLQGLSKFVTLIKYDEGGLFEMHKDFLTGSFYTKNFLTLNLYLNTLEKGGELYLYNDDFTRYHTEHPQEGKAIIFDMDTYHEANKVIKSKYFLKCGISYNKI